MHGKAMEAVLEASRLQINDGKGGMIGNVRIKSRGFVDSLSLGAVFMVK